MSKGRCILAVMVLAVFMTLLPGCTGVRKIKDIKVNSVGVKYVTPTSSRSVEGVLLLEIDNPAMGFTVSQVDGTVRRDSRVMGYFTAGELPLQARSVQVYELPCTVTLAESVSILEVITLIAKGSLEGFTADVSLHARLRNGIGKDLTFNGLDIEKLAK